MKSDELEKKIRSLSSFMRDELLHYIDHLIARSKNEVQSEKKFSFNWEGSLSELKDEFSSVELQHEAKRWR